MNAYLPKDDSVLIGDVLTHIKLELTLFRALGAVVGELRVGEKSDVGALVAGRGRRAETANPRP